MLEVNSSFAYLSSASTSKIAFTKATTSAAIKSTDCLTVIDSSCCSFVAKAVASSLADSFRAKKRGEGRIAVATLVKSDFAA